MPDLWRILLILLFICPFSSAQETHSHSAPEKLGKVSFPISCTPAVQEQFDRGVALLHSFAYTAAENAFQGVAELDPRCAMAHWGMAMAHFHQLWDPPIVPATIPIAQKEIQRAQQIGTGSERERQFINALSLIYQDAATVPYRARALNSRTSRSTMKFPAASTPLRSVLGCHESAPAGLIVCALHSTAADETLYSHKL